MLVWDIELGPGKRLILVTPNVYNLQWKFQTKWKFSNDLLCVPSQVVISTKMRRYFGANVAKT